MHLAGRRDEHVPVHFGEEMDVHVAGDVEPEQGLVGRLGRRGREGRLQDGRCSHRVERAADRSDGRVERLSPASGSQFALLPPDNATGNFTKVVQRIPVRIALDKKQPLLQRLLPGMSVITRIDIGDGRT